MKYKTIKLKRLYNNVASARDYVVKDCINKDIGIRFECNGAHMHVSLEELKASKPVGRKFKSKFTNQQYQLVDFEWKQEPLFNE